MSDDIVSRCFASLGLATLAELVERGDLSSISDRDLANYCRLAASVDGPPLVSDGNDARAGARELFGFLFFEVLSGEGPDYTEIDGEPYLRLPAGLTWIGPDELCHLERLVALLSDDALARAFLALAPQWARSEAQTRVGEVWDAAFFDIAERAR
jgi:hypothetical protein